jgi:hypothetical protein
MWLSDVTEAARAITTDASAGGSHGTASWYTARAEPADGDVVVA